MLRVSAYLFAFPPMTMAQALCDAGRNDGVPAAGCEELEARGVWNARRDAVVLATRHDGRSHLSVHLRGSDGGVVVVDVSQVEDRNLGKLGLCGRACYERARTFPVRWLEREDGRWQVVLRTQAWQRGQRYTVEEPLVLERDGKALWR